MDIRLQDVARQVATVIGALFQVVVPITSASGISQVANEIRSLVVPAGYAFLIWNLIFLLALLYAVYQALPVNRENTLLQRIGWWVAAAFIGDGVWELVFPARLLVFAQTVIVGTFLCLAVASYLLIRTTWDRPLRGGARWLVAPLLGLSFGWVSVATFVGFMSTLVGMGVLRREGVEIVVGAAVLFVCGVFASAALLFWRTGSGGGSLAYAAAVIWGLLAIIVTRPPVLIVTASAGAMALVVIAGTSFANPFSKWLSQRGHQPT